MLTEKTLTQPSSVNRSHVIAHMKLMAAATFPKREGKSAENFLFCRIPKVIFFRDV